MVILVNLGDLVCDSQIAAKRLSVVHGLFMGYLSIYIYMCIYGISSSLGTKPMYKWGDTTL